MKRLMTLGLVLLLTLSTIVFADGGYDDEIQDQTLIEEKYQKKAAHKNMTVEAYKAAMKKSTKEEFAEMLKEKGLTEEEYKLLITEKYMKLAAEKGLTLDEYKSLIYDKKKNHSKLSKEEFQNHLSEKGITLEAYKEMVNSKSKHTYKKKRKDD